MVRLFTTPRSQQGDREGNRIKQICGGKRDKSHDGVRRKCVNFDLAFSPFLVKRGKTSRIQRDKIRRGNLQSKDSALSNWFRESQCHMHTTLK